jgi:hypothetical protein
MGMTYDELMDLTPRVFSNKVQGWTRQQSMMMQDQWERARWMVSTTISPHLKKPIKPTDLVKFNWEKKPKVTPKSVNFGELLTEASRLGITL